MSKRVKTDSATSNPKNWHPTPRAALEPLLPLLEPGTEFVEPCAGDGRLIEMLEEAGHRCIWAIDVEPRGGNPLIECADATRCATEGLTIITNPPFERRLLDPLLAHWLGRSPLWLLLPADMICNIWTIPLTRRVDRIVPLGRVSWMDNGTGGFENYAWLHAGLEHVDLIVPRKAAKHRR